MKNETLYWTIGGVGLALLALFAMSRGGSTTTSSGGGGVDAASLTSMTNVVNTSAAAVEEARIGALRDYAIHSSSDQVSAYTVAENTAANELQTVENARTTRMANDENFRLGELTANLNHLDTQAGIQGGVTIAGIQGATAAQQADDQLKAAQAQAQAQVDTAKANKPTWFQSLMGAVGSIFKVTAKI